jgi:cytochrome c oxidase assembly protein Cox11
MNGRESFDLIRENGEWRIFYDWASANKVKLKLVPPRDSGIEARLSSNEFVAKPSAPFEVSFTLTNHNGVPVSVRLIHHVEPRSVENHLEMIACGALAPVALQPGESQEISMAYVLSPGFGAGRKIQLSYELKPEPARPQTIAEPASNLRLNEQIDRRFVKQ